LKRLTAGFPVLPPHQSVNCLLPKEEKGGTVEWKLFATNQQAVTKSGNLTFTPRPAAGGKGHEILPVLCGNHQGENSGVTGPA
jgi:hypothetical protein